MTTTAMSNASPLAQALAYTSSFETKEEDEQETQGEFIETLLGISQKTYEDTGLGLRSVHAKGHGLLRGELEVLPAPALYAQGLFREPRTYPVVIRLSTSPGDVLDDKVSTPRGFALKVFGVEGERLPGSEGATQDFLMVNGPAFLAPTAKKFLGSLKMLAGTTDKVPRLKLAFSAVLRGTEKVIEAVGGESATLKSMGGHPETNILGETFFSQVPFLYGPYMAKWSVAPVSPTLVALKDAPVDLEDKPDGLRAAVAEHFASEGGEWEFRVQLCTGLDDMPVEDASVEWPQDKSPFIAVARIRVQPQEAWSEQRAGELDDGTSFSPWHGLAEHRPLGSVNRARLATYQSSADARSPRGRCPVHVPSSEA